jgi:O-antigen biosynthesis protein
MNKFKELQQNHEMAPRVMSPLRGRQKRTRKSERRAQAILVLGMHRSGTSAVTRVLNLLGADLPRNLLGSRPGNDSGHWESTDLLAIHEDILLSAGSAWDDWRSFDPAWCHSAAAQTYKEKILAILAHDFGESKLFAIKDPRICRFAPFWLDVLKSFGSHPKVVIPVRDPLEVAGSLRERDGFCVEKGYLLWLRHFLDAEQSTRGLPRAILTYDKLLSDWSAVAADVTSRTKIIWPQQPADRETEIERFLAPGLRHHVSSPEQILGDVEIVDWVREAYAALLHMAEVGEDDTDMARLDRVRSEFDKAALAFGPALAGEELELRAVRASLANSTGRVQELEAGIIAYRDEADRLREALDALRTQHDETSSELAVAVGRVQELDAGVLAYREEAERLREALTASQSELQVAQNELQVVYASHSWRLTAPLRAVRSLGTRLSQNVREWIHGTVDAIYQILPGAMQARRQDVQHPPLPEPIDPVPLNEEPLKILPAVRVIAFYLPQFHPIPENDEFWGRGFTEWTNVTRAAPQFEGHYQPRLPGELGFYDLRVIDVQRRQVELAKLYGVGGFCFYFYWFGGKRVLERPLEQYLAHRDLDLPFCLCWANENWTRTWDGGAAKILVEQAHSAADDVAFIVYLSKYLNDERYLRVNNRPLVVVYRPSLLPSAKETAERWRSWCRDNGIGEIVLAYVQSFERPDPAEYGFDAAIEFPPNAMGCPLYAGELALLNPAFAGIVYDWDFFRQRSATYEVPPYRLLRGVCPSWDNEARRPGRGAVMLGSSPERYCEWLRNAINDTLNRFKQPSERLVFINAWNEWAEGAYLEPDNRYGYAYLQATRTALEETARCEALDSHRQSTDQYGDDSAKALEVVKAAPIHTEASVVLVGHDGHPHGAQFLALSLLREFSQALRLRVECVLLRDGKLKSKYAEIAPVHSLNGANPRGGEARRLASELRRRGFQKAICNTTVSGLFAETLKEVGFEIVSLVHELPNLIEGYEGRGLKQEAQSIARAADRIVFAAQPIADKFHCYTNFNKEKIWIQPQGLYKRNSLRTRSEIDEARRDVRKRLGITPGTPIVLSVGFGDARKGVDLFVEIGQRVLNSNPDAAFVWVGELDALIAGEIRNRLKHSKHARRFVFPGFSSDTDRFFASADVFALPSREDPFPSVLLEAFDAGLPVVSFTGVGGFEKFIQDNRLGLLVPAFDTASFADAVRTLIADGTDGHRTGSAGRALVTREFSFQKYAYDLATLARVPVKRTSVIVPSFNYLQYLEARLASIAGQTLAPYEVVVLDDASTDGSVEWLDDNVHRICPNAELLVNEVNSGSVFRQWLAGVERARGDYIWIAEADDLADPAFLEEVLRAFDDPDVVMSFCQSRQMASDGKILCDSYLDYVADVSSTKWTTSYVNRGVDEILTSLSIKNTIPNVSAVVFRREVLRAALKAKIDNLHALRVAGDWVTYIEVLQHGKIAFSPRSLNSHRRHSSSVTLSSFNLSQLREIMLVQQMVRDRFPVPDSVTRAAEVYAEQLFQQFGLATDQMASIHLHPELTSLCVSNAHSGARRQTFGRDGRQM